MGIHATEIQMELCSQPHQLGNTWKSIKRTTTQPPQNNNKIYTQMAPSK